MFVPHLTTSMRKSIFSALLFLFASAAFAQPVSKKGEYYLPQAGDWALGIDAAPFLNYIGNFFSDDFNSAPSAAFANSQFAIVGKKFVRDDFAYRGSFRLGILADNQRAFSPEFSNDPTNTTVEDSYGRTFTNAVLSFGVEKRKGNTRVQGYYGAEGLVGFGTEKHTFDYGNTINPQNTNPDRTEWIIDFQNDPREVTTVTEVGGFITEYRQGSTFHIGARAFAGVEIWTLVLLYGQCPNHF